MAQVPFNLYQVVFGKGTLQRFPLAFLLGFAGVGQLPCNGFPVHQGGSGALPDFVQHKAVKDIGIRTRKSRQR